MKKVIVNGKEANITIRHLSKETVSFALDGVTYNYRQTAIKCLPFEIVLKQEQENHFFYWDQDRGVIDGRDIVIEEPSLFMEASPHKTVVHEKEDDGIQAPMPGKILQINVEIGERVDADQILAVLEAMKMEHTIKSPKQGIVETISWNIGDRVEEGAILMELKKKI